MMHRPKLVILDEPVSALDPIGRREVLDMMRKLKEQTTILFSTHVLPDAQEITDDLFIMNKGEIVISGSMRELIERHREPVIRLRGEQPLEGRIAELTALTGVESALWKGDYAELVFADLEAGRQALLRYIADHQIAVRKLELAELSLEDLFMKAVHAG
jgi:ABC-2 type transport system ATP-binding protein